MREVITVIIDDHGERGPLGHLARETRSYVMQTVREILDAYEVEYSAEFAEARTEEDE